MLKKLRKKNSEKRSYWYKEVGNIFALILDTEKGNIIENPVQKQKKNANKTTFSWICV